MTLDQWQAVERAEELIYGDQYASRGFTRIHARTDAGIADALWLNASEQVEATTTHDEWDTRPFDEMARRVATCLAILAFGPEVLS